MRFHQSPVAGCAEHYGGCSRTSRPVRSRAVVVRALSDSAPLAAWSARCRQPALVLEQLDRLATAADVGFNPLYRRIARVRLSSCAWVELRPTSSATRKARCSASRSIAVELRRRRRMARGGSLKAPLSRLLAMSSRRCRWHEAFHAQAGLPRFGLLERPDSKLMSGARKRGKAH